MNRLIPLAAAAMVLAGSAAQAQDKLKIGVIATLSGPPAVLGQQLRNGFNLAVKTLGGKLGGRDVEVLVQDDELKPDLAVTKVKAFVERDKVDFVVGPIFSNILQAIMKPVTEGGAILISPNAGTSNFAGKECNPNFFVTSYQNDQVFGVSGQARAGHRHQEGVPDRAQLPGRQGRARGLQALLQGRDRRRGLCAARPARLFGGAVQDRRRQARTPSTCSCRAAWASISSSSSARPGSPTTITFLSAFTVDESTLPAQQDAALGFFGGSNWAPNLDNPQNKAFVAAYEKEFNAVPATYAFQAYDAALLIDSARQADQRQYVGQGRAARGA